MRSSTIHCLFGTTALTLLTFDQASFADDALTAGSKSIVREFYTTVLINRDVDTFRARFAQPLPADYKRELLNIVAESDLVIIYVRQTWTSRDGKHTNSSGSTCFVCKMVRLRNIGTRMIELDAIIARHRQRSLILFSLDRQSRVPGIFLMLCRKNT